MSSHKNRHIYQHYKSYIHFNFYLLSINLLLSASRDCRVFIVNRSKDNKEDIRPHAELLLILFPMSSPCHPQTSNSHSKVM